MIDPARENAASHLFRRLDDFIHQYYRSRWVLGLLYFGITAVLLFVSFSSIEYFGYFSGTIRIIFIVVFIFSVAGIGLRYFLLPFLAYRHYASRLTYVAASRILSAHFPEIKDNLLNALQLHEMGKAASFDPAYLEASIAQKVKGFDQIPFYGAIDRRKPAVYLSVLACVIALVLGVFVWYPSVLLQGSRRIMQYNRPFTRPAPFTFHLINSGLAVEKNSLYALSIRVEGTSLPDEVFVEDGLTRERCTRLNPTLFSFEFNHVQKAIRFRLSGAGFYSVPYTLEVFKRPQLIAFQQDVTFPAYLRRPPLHVPTGADLSLPEGSLVYWTLKTADADSLLFLSKGHPTLIHRQQDQFQLSKKVIESFDYTLVPKSKKAPSVDSFRFSIVSIKDEFPQISLRVEKTDDSVGAQRFFGDIKDDYGFTALLFHAEYTHKSSTSGLAEIKKKYVVPIRIQKEAIQQVFSVQWDPSSIPLSRGKDITCYFEVLDNDGVHGPKSTQTDPIYIHRASQEEEQVKKNSIHHDITTKLILAFNQSKQLEKTSKSLIDKMGGETQWSFSDKERMKTLLQEKSSLDSALLDIQNKNRSEGKLSPGSSNKNEQLQRNEQEMSNLLNNLVSKEAELLFHKLSKLLESGLNHDTKQSLRDFRQDNLSVQEELKRTQELYRQLERDREIQNLVDRLHELSGKEQAIVKQALQEKKGALADKLKQEETNQKKKFDEFREKTAALEKENLADKANPDFKNPKAEISEISTLQDKIQQALHKNNRSEAAGLEELTGSKMENLAAHLGQMKQVADAEKMTNDLSSLRKLLQNLIRISFKQEAIMLGLSTRKPGDPALNDFTREQYALKEPLVQAQDSVRSLSYKVPAIQPFIFKELKSMTSNLEQVSTLLADGQRSEAQNIQQHLMTSVNTVALLLGRVEKQMAQALSNLKGPAGRSGNNVSLNALISKQKELGEKIAQAGKSLSGSGEKSNEGVLRLAAEQQAIRQTLDRMRLNSGGKGKLPGDLSEIEKEMMESETDLLNKRIKTPVDMQQKRIVTRMIEAEKAQQEQGFDKEREAVSGQQTGRGSPKELVLSTPDMHSSQELLKPVPATMNSYYKLKINTYFNLLNDSQPRNEKLGTH